jgi:hypothetical protein
MRRGLVLLALIIAPYAGSLGCTVDHGYVQIATNPLFDHPVGDGIRRKPSAPSPRSPICRSPRPGYFPAL